jgi:predicted transcriptional regulator of viral defense system
VNPAQQADRQLDALAAEQSGVFSRRQARDLGASKAMIEHRLGTGAWSLVLPGVFRLASAPPSSRQAATAATLWSAPDGLVAVTSAANLWELDGEWGTRVHVLVERGRGLRSSKVTVHHTTDLLPADVATLGPIRLTSPLRTVIEVTPAALRHPDDLVALVAVALAA